MWITACGRQAEVHTYVEQNQLPPPRPQPRMSGVPEVPEEFRAGPLNVEPVPENLPPDHPEVAGRGDRPTLPGANMRGRESEVPPPPASSDVVWETPSGWESAPASGMRLAVFRPAGVDPERGLVTLIALNSQPLEPNVRRWRRQVGLPEEHKHDHVLIEGGLPYTLVNLVAESAAADMPTSTIGAIYNLPNRTLFLKFTGETELLVEHKAGFLQLAQSVAMKEDIP